jgi:hypothetical protein
MQREQYLNRRYSLISSDDVAHTLKEDHTYTLQAVPWMGRVWASNKVKSVSLSSTWLSDLLYVSCFSLFKAIKDT